MTTDTRIAEALTPDEQAFWDRAVCSVLSNAGEAVSVEEEVRYAAKVADAALAARRAAPKPMKPEDVEPGTRFRTAECDPEDPAFIMVENVETGERFALNERTHSFRPIFSEVDQIIPIEESDQ